MRKVILYIAASLDGFIARPDGDVSWLEKYQTTDEDYGYTNFLKTIGASIMGSKTYEKALTLKGGIDSKMPTYVVTGRKLALPAGADVSFYSGNLKNLVKVACAKTPNDIWLVGGGELARSFLTEGLVDEIILSVIPDILGEGIPLFCSIGKKIHFDMTGSEAFTSGIIQTHYIAASQNRRVR